MAARGGLLALLLWLRLLQPVRGAAAGRGAGEAPAATPAGPQAPRPAAQGQPAFPRTRGADGGDGADGADGTPEPGGGSAIKELFPSACGRRMMRIVGGTIVPERKWPWQVSLQTGQRHVCGGSLITNRWVMTAAHCINGVWEYEVMLGHNTLYSTAGPTTVVAKVEDIVYHPSYDARNLHHDVALVLLAAPVDYSPHIQPVCLPERPFRVEAGALCWVTGWGQIENQALTVFLREAEQKIVLRDTCNKYFQKWFKTSRNLVRKGMICGHHEELHTPCKGDSGGPLVCSFNSTWIQVGIVSWGIDCGKNLPAVYTEVMEYKEWVKGILSGAPWRSAGAHLLLLCLVFHLGVLVAGDRPCPRPSRF